MQVWGNLVDEVSKEGRRLDLRDPIRWFKNFCRFPERSLGTDPHRLGTTHAQTAQDGWRVAPHGAMEAIKLLISLMETTSKKKGQRANTAGPDGCETWREQNHMQQDTWTQTADKKHVKGGKAIYLLSHTQLHARLSKHSSIGRPLGRESTWFFNLGIRTKYSVIKLLKYLLNYGDVVKSNNIPVDRLQRSIYCLFF